MGEYALVLTILGAVAAVSALALKGEVAALWETPVVVIASVSPDADGSSAANSFAAMEAVSHALLNPSLRSGDEAKVMLANGDSARRAGDSDNAWTAIWKSWDWYYSDVTVDPAGNGA